jgi:hypothetical protein
MVTPPPGVQDVAAGRLDRAESIDLGVRDRRNSVHGHVTGLRCSLLNQAFAGLL